MLPKSPTWRRCSSSAGSPWQSPLLLRLFAEAIVNTPLPHGRGVFCVLSQKQQQNVIDGKNEIWYNIASERRENRMGATRRSSYKIYGACLKCPQNCEGVGRCTWGHENFYKRRSKNNGCMKCTLWMLEQLQEEDRLRRVRANP